jgi:hypothetical protein
MTTNTKLKIVVMMMMIAIVGMRTLTILLKSTWSLIQLVRRNLDLHFPRLFQRRHSVPSLTSNCFSAAKDSSEH